jgi:hypothetical protein
MNALKLIFAAGIAGISLAASACEYPDEGNMPLRRAVTRVEMLPDVAEWHRDMVRKGVEPQYVVRLDELQQHRGKCFWTVEVHAEGRLWRRYLVSPDGKNVRLRE